MKKQLDMLSLKKHILNDSSDGCSRHEQDVQARRREMLKIVVSDFKRGDADEVLDSIANFNFVLKPCGLEAVAYFDKVGSAEEETDLGTLVQRLVSKDFEVVASMRAEFGERGGRGGDTVNTVLSLLPSTPGLQARQGGVDYLYSGSSPTPDAQARQDDVQGKVVSFVLSSPSRPSHLDHRHTGKY